MHLFVFANLYAYRTTKYEINTTNAFADNPNNHVINPLIGNNKDYKMLLVNLSERSICSCTNFRYGVKAKAVRQ